MKAAIGRETVLSVALAVGALLMVGVLAWEWQEGKSLEAELMRLRKMPVTDVPAQKILAEFTLPNSAAGFPELVARNLFSANRRSAAPADKAGESVMKKGQFTLVGVMITPQKRSALLRDVQTNKTEAVAVVGVIRGITLGEVEPSRVVLRQGAETEELLLNVQTGPKRPVSQPAQPTAVTATATSATSAAAAAAETAAAAAQAVAARVLPAPPTQALATNPVAAAPSAAAKPAEKIPVPKPPSNIQVPLSK